MMVLVVAACPQGLRGDITKWLLEIAPGVFVGEPSARIREALWDRTRALSGSGRAIIVYSSDKEQGISFDTYNYDWYPTDFDGLTLMMRPSATKNQQPKTGWSKARNIRRSQK